MGFHQWFSSEVTQSWGAILSSWENLHFPPAWRWEHSHDTALPLFTNSNVFLACFPLQNHRQGEEGQTWFPAHAITLCFCLNPRQGVERALTLCVRDQQQPTAHFHSTPFSRSCCCLSVCHASPPLAFTLTTRFLQDCGKASSPHRRSIGGRLIGWTGTAARDGNQNRLHSVSKQSRKTNSTKFSHL